MKKKRILLFATITLTFIGRGGGGRQIFVIREKKN